MIINVLNETEDAYSLELELNPTFCRSVLLKLKLIFLPVSKPRQINSIFTINRPILYIYL